MWYYFFCLQFRVKRVSYFDQFASCTHLSFTVIRLDCVLIILKCLWVFLKMFGAFYVKCKKKKRKITSIAGTQHIFTPDRFMIVS